MSNPVATPPGLSRIPGITARFFGRIHDVEVALERHEAMARLAPLHRQLLDQEGLGSFPFVTAEQIHGRDIALVETGSHHFTPPIPGVDGLMTRSRGITLGIYVADCAPVWVVARNGSVGAILHSGKKGTELGIVPKGITMLCELGNLTPADLIVVIGPCIRPPCYEVDFAAKIAKQAAEMGVLEIHDEGICTACHPGLYYSYRREHGLTGRMLATLTLLPS
jgi:copper oxidase (laccase) domain-containing protein